MPKDKEEEYSRGKKKLKYRGPTRNLIQRWGRRGKEFTFGVLDLPCFY